MPADLIATIITVVLSGGALATIQAVFRGVGSLRSGARAREKEAVSDLARWRDELDERARRAEADRDYWRVIAMQYAGQLHRAGLEPKPAEPMPPSERIVPRP